MTLTFRQLLDVARGLAYLHQSNIVHGNLTGVSFNCFSRTKGGLTTPQHNILVDRDGVACISEYGIEGVPPDASFPESIPTNVRWMAPEVLSKEKQVTSVGDGKCADVYSLAIVMFEVG